MALVFLFAQSVCPHADSFAHLLSAEGFAGINTVSILFFRIIKYNNITIFDKYINYIIIMIEHRSERTALYFRVHSVP